MLLATFLSIDFTLSIGKLRIKSIKGFNNKQKRRRPAKANGSSKQIQEI